MNPLLYPLDQPIPFHLITPESITDAVNQVTNSCACIRDQILSSDPTSKYHRLYGMDRLEAELDRICAPIYLLKETHPSPEIREVCHEAIKTLFELETRFNLDEQLYRSLEAYSLIFENLDPVEQRYLTKRLEDYQLNGFQLGEDQRQILKELDNQINQVELAFQRNISDDNQVCNFLKQDCSGLPQDYLARHLGDEGIVSVPVRMPDYTLFMKSVHSRAAREKLYYAYVTRARETNLPLLKEMIQLRVQKSELLGFPTFSTYKLSDKMAQNPKRVWTFLEDLAEKVEQKARQDLKRLEEMATDSVSPWDKLYLTNLLKEQKYQLSEEDMKAYFPLDQVLAGLFDLTATLYNVTFVKITLPTWHPDVQTFELKEADQLIGRVYLDLFPRPNKYSHAACFGIRSGRMLDTGYLSPVAALVCNFTPATPDKPPLLTHDEVETLFHEFGHLLHQLLTQARFHRFAGTSVLRDFVEMPSQMMENWAWEQTILKSFARHYQTGETIPESMLSKLLELQLLNSGLDIQQQLFYAALDLSYHDGFIPKTELDVVKIAWSVADHFTTIPIPKDSCMQASFSHLVNYASGYYGYLWSQVYAQDLFSEFKKGGVTSPNVGARFRKHILAQGNSEDPGQLIEQFLGRPLNIEPFLESIGVLGGSK